MGVKRGDIYYVEKSSYYQTTGSEQYPGRPAIVVSNDVNNEHSETVEIVYLTTRPKTDLPTHIDIRSATKPSVALCEQVTTVSVERLGSYVGRCTEQELVMLEAALAISLNIACGEPKVVEKIVDKPVPAEAPQLPFVDDGGETVIRLKTERDMY